ncbi:MAG: Lacal_2735 family protein [Winogradskyella sp.]|uniref:Lacal_2735 family protein n=1 Tax=Winogradskyella sp. TaxID=1883156 RepID=UPI0017F6DE17|nr:Lacal_2735 family protein [Winogradskyella sp.]MBT8245362.1 Lacal_2735 family protein [Winogradskyella sp.]NNK23635.1 Lacal_2735 family protein [Winogradskyella sp.]
MSCAERLLQEKRELKQKYLFLIEDSYNHKQIDQAYSDLSEFKAIQVLNRINELKFVVTDSQFSL